MKNKFLKSTFTLMIGTILAKLLGFIIKIIFTRIIKDGINLYSIIMPTYTLLIALAQLGLPYAISSLVSRKKYTSTKILSSIIPVALFFNVIIIVITIFISKPLAINLLKNKDAYLPILSICFVLPFTTISGIIKGYYFGKQNMMPNAVSSIFEQLARLILMIIILPICMKYNTIIAVSAYVIISSVSEFIQIIVYLFFAPKNLTINIKEVKPSIEVCNDLLSISIPSVMGRLIGNIFYFLEPIILTNVLLYVGYSNDYILSEYGAYNAFVIPILTMPSFITLTLNTTLIPEISKNYNNYSYIKKLLLKCLSVCFVLGIIYCILVYFNAEFILNLVFDTNKGIEYLKVLSIFFPLFYLEGPLVSVLQGLNYASSTMKITFVACLIKTLSILLLSLFGIGIYSLIISEIIDIIIVLFLCIRKLYSIIYK